MVIGILVILFAMAFPIGVDFYTSYQLTSETRLLVALLEQARNRAMVNYYESDHGLYIGASDLVLFQGHSYATRDSAQDQDFPRASYVTITGSSELAFEALAGRTASSTITLTNGRQTKYVYVNQEGQIQF